MGRLAGKRAVVTGAGAGIGRSIALLFAREGADVGIIDRDGQRADQTRRAIAQGGGHAQAWMADVADAAAIDEVFGAVAREMGGLDVLVNNAGAVRRRSFERLADADWAHMWETNLRGAVTCIRSALPLLRRAQPGKIVNVASIAAFRHARKLTAYAATKGALASLSTSLAVELGPVGIHVNYICPGLVYTEMTRKQLDRWLVRRWVSRRTPLQRLGSPDDVARVAVFLASADSDFVTGQGIVVDGGLSLRGV